MLPKYRLGPVTYDIKASHGADPNSLNFYSSTYSAHHGKEGFKPRTTRHYGTGYISNYRPGVYYSTELDDYDNPIIRDELRDNYHTSHMKQFRPCHDSNGKDQFPLGVITRETGFSQNPPAGFVPYNTTYGTRAMLVEDGERYKPRLHRIQRKRVPQIDIGTMEQVTETKLIYQGEPWEKLNIHQMDVGSKEVSGWTDHHHEDPIQYLPKDAFRAIRFCWRPTGPTIYEKKYRLWSDADGKEPKGNPLKGSNRKSGFTNDNGLPHYISRIPDDAFTKKNQVHPLEAEWTKKHDPAEYENMKLAAEKKSLTRCWFEGRQLPYNPKQYDNQGKTQQLSGYSIDHTPYMESINTPNNFRTHYQERISFQPKRDGYINRMDTDKLPDGFTNGTKINHFGDRRRFREVQLEKLTPFIARRIKKEEPYLTSRTMNYKWKNDYTVWDPPI